MPAAMIFCLARVSRLATVASGTEKARAISAVVSPATARRVRGDLHVAPEGRVATGEDQPQPVVGLPVVDSGRAATKASFSR